MSEWHLTSKRHEWLNMLWAAVCICVCLCGTVHKFLCCNANGCKRSSLRNAEGFVWRKPNRPNIRKRNFWVNDKTLRMLDKNYLSSKTLQSLAWSIDKEGVQGSFANCTGYLQSNRVHSRRYSQKDNDFFSLNISAAKSRKRTATSRNSQVEDVSFWGTAFTRHLHAILWSF